ncbi:MAG: ferritin-like domain-containing protein [Firmicutes bacterium]|nr:ferritin-like domain-containing protein [Bacillota bacterium]
MEELWETDGKQDFDAMLLQAIADERQAIDFYGRLMQAAPNSFHREQINDPYQDEKKHNRWLTKLYEQREGHAPEVSYQRVVFSNYREGLRKAMDSELSAAEMYRTMLVMSHQMHEMRLVELFYMIMTDEMIHATRFTYLRATLRS